MPTKEPPPAAHEVRHRVLHAEHRAEHVEMQHADELLGVLEVVGAHAAAAAGVRDARRRARPVPRAPRDDALARPLRSSRRRRDPATLPPWPAPAVDRLGRVVELRSPCGRRS